MTEILGEEMPETVTGDTVLTVEPPFDEMYRHFVEAQIHYANGEMDRYNNAVLAWSGLFTAYRDHCSHRGTLRQGPAALKLC